MSSSFLLPCCVHSNILGQKSTFYPKSHTLKIPIFTKFTFLKPQFSQNSLFSNIKIQVSPIFCVNCKGNNDNSSSKIPNANQNSDNFKGFSSHCAVILSILCNLCDPNETLFEIFSTNVQCVHPLCAP